MTYIKTFSIERRADILLWKGYKFKGNSVEF